MAFTNFKFTPGLNKDDSPLSSEGGYIDADKVRFAAGQPQTIGGWDFATLDTFTGIARGAYAWADSRGQRYSAFGTAAKLYAIVGGAIRDITPLHSEGVIVGPFTTQFGSPTVTVAHANHGFSAGMTVRYANAAPVGGLTLTGAYQVAIDDEDTYTITAASNATAAATGGGNVDYTAILPAGLVDGIGEPGGYGTGTYGGGGYGTTDAIDSLPRVWFLDSWGETLVALPRGGGLYQYQPALTYPELVAGGDFSSAVGWTAEAGWAVSGGVAAATAGTESNISHPIALREGYVYRVVFDVTVTAGNVVVQSDSGSLGDASWAVSVSGTFSRRFRAPAGTTQLQFHKDAAFAGSIDNVSLTLESTAYRVDEAPRRNAGMFVDPHQIVVLLGTAPFGGVYNPMALRWCDRQNIALWAPASDNLAGDDILAGGSRLVAGRATRQQNALWSDAGMFTMQYTGDATQPFIFQSVGAGCGLIGALAHDEHDGIVYWASNSGNFYRFAGAAPEPLPSTLRRDFFEHIAANQGEKVVCGILPTYSEVWFFKPDARDGNECSRYVALRWDEGHSTAGTFGRSAWVKPGVYDSPMAWGTDGHVYFHERGDTAAGGVIEWFIESAYFDIGAGENLAFLRRIIGDFEDLKGGANFTITARAWPTAAEIGYGPFFHTAETRKIDLRITARQLKVRIAGASAPAFMRMGALRLDIIPIGAKR